MCDETGRTDDLGYNSPGFTQRNLSPPLTRSQSAPYQLLRHNVIFDEATLRIQSTDKLLQLHRKCGIACQVNAGMHVSICETDTGQPEQISLSPKQT